MNKERNHEYIDEKGNVLKLNQELLDERVAGFPPYKNKPDGLGIFNWLITHVIYMSHSRWPLALKLYKFFIRFSAWMKQGGLKAQIYKRGIKLEPNEKMHTGTVVLPLNVDITDQSQKVVVPMDVIRETLKNASYIAGMRSCLCREANDCQDYPHDLGCIFLGEAAKIVVKHDLGKQITYEEACAIWMLT